MSKNANSFVVKYTNKDIMEKLEGIDHKVEKVHEQAKMTNGRVTHLEYKSLGLWISNNPFKFTMYILILVAIVISDIRHPIIELILKLL